MKTKHKPLLILLSVILAMTLMPMFASGASNEEAYWTVEAEREDITMSRTQTEVTLRVVPRFYGYSADTKPNLHYQWYRSYYNGKDFPKEIIEGANDQVYVASTDGSYYCNVSDESGNTQEVGIYVEYEFNEYEALTEELKQTADSIQINEQITVNTKEKDGLFRFIPEKDGIYVFSSKHIVDEGKTFANPRARILNENGQTIEQSYQRDDNNFIIYFNAEAGKTYYLQAINCQGDATFDVTLSDDDIESMSFEQKAPYELIDTWKLWTYNTGDYSNVPEGVEDGDKFWLQPDFMEGDRLIVNKKDGSSITYEAKRRSQNWVEFENLQDKNDTLDHSVELVADRFWAPEKTYQVGTEANVEIEVSYQKHSIKAVCAIKFSPNPYSDLSVEGEHIKAKLTNDDRWAIDLSGTQFFVTKNGSKQKYEVVESGFYDETRIIIQLKNEDTGDQIVLRIPIWGYTLGEGFWTPGNTYKTDVFFEALGIDFEVEVDTSCLDHAWEWNGGRNATCMEKGEATYICRNCGETKTEELPVDLKAHNSVRHLGKSPTCIADGSVTFWKCELCGRCFSDFTCENECNEDVFIIPATGKHNWDAGKVTKSSTYTSTGIKTFTCTVCGKTRTEPIAKLAKVTNPLAIKAVKKTVKATKLKSKAATVSGAVTFTKKGAGKISYSGTGTNTKAKKALKINTSTGKITVKKGTKKGTYKMKVKVKAAGTTKYKAGSKTVTVTIIVK